MSCGEAASDAASVAAPSIAELEPSPNKENTRGRVTDQGHATRDQEDIRIRVTLSK
jgi:hypothetical protein